MSGLHRPLIALAVLGTAASLLVAVPAQQHRAAQSLMVRPGEDCTCPDPAPPPRIVFRSTPTFPHVEPQLPERSRAQEGVIGDLGSGGLSGDFGGRPSATASPSESVSTTPVPRPSITISEVPPSPDDGGGGADEGGGAGDGGTGTGDGAQDGTSLDGDPSDGRPDDGQDAGAGTDRMDRPAEPPKAVPNFEPPPPLPDDPPQPHSPIAWLWWLVPLILAALLGMALLRGRDERSASDHREPTDGVDPDLALALGRARAAVDASGGRDLEAEVRAVFLAGLLDLQTSGRHTYDPAETSRRVDAALQSPGFRQAWQAHQTIVYGRRPATEEHVHEVQDGFGQIRREEQP